MSWIKLHRKMYDWGWITTPNTAHLFTVILLRANFKETKWRGETLAPGQLLTGRKQLSVFSGLSEQQVRTALKNLESTNEIAIKPTRKYSVISVVNWEKYQSLEGPDPAINQQSTSKITNNQPTINQQVTTSKKEKKEKKEKNIYTDFQSEIFEAFKNELNKICTISKDPLSVIIKAKKKSAFEEAIKNYPEIESWGKIFSTFKHVCLNDSFWKDQPKKTIAFFFNTSSTSGLCQYQVFHDRTIKSHLTEDQKLEAKLTELTSKTEFEGEGLLEYFNA